MDKQRCIPLCICMAAFLSSLAFAQQAGAPEQRKQATIEGSVMHSQSRESLPGAEVTLMRTDYAPMVVHGGGPKPPPTMLQTTTDQTGNYRFLNVEPGRYTLTARKLGYGDSERRLSVARIQISSGEIATGVNIELAPQTIIIGRIVDEDGKPVPHVQVIPLREQYVNGRKQLYPFGGNFATSEQGEFRLAGVWTGQLILGLLPIRVLQPTPTGVTARAPDMAYVTTYYSATADVSQATRITVSPGMQLSGLKGTLGKARVSPVRGRVLDPAGQLAERYHVILMPADPAWTGGILTAHVTKTMNGTFEFQHVHAGAYRLIVQSELQPALLYRESITLGTQEPNNLEVRMPPPVKVEGEILVKGNVGVKLQDVMVALHHDVEGVMHLPGPRRTTSDGEKFVFDPVLPGKYRITASFLNPLPSVYIESIRYGDRDVIVGQAEITARPSAIRITIGSGAGSATGIVMKDNKPAQEATVLLLSAERSLRLAQSWPITTRSDENARFTIERIPPGDYLAFAFDEVEQGFWKDDERFRKFENAAKKISIASGGAANVNLEITALPAE